MSTMPAPLEGADRFASVAAAVADPVRRYLSRRCDEATADDALSATLSALWRHRTDLPAGDPVPWAIGVARLQLQTVRRLQRRQTLLAQRMAVADPPRLHDDDAPSATDDTVRLALARLLDADAELLRLRAWEQLDASGIAEVLGTAPEPVAARLDRARARFAEMLPTGADDHETRRLLRAIDPARDLPPLSRDELADRLAAASGVPGSTPATVHRRRSPWLIAGVGALSAGAAASLLLPFALGVVDGGAATSLTLPPTGGPGSVCAPVSAAALAPAELAFRAEVSAIDGSTVTLHVLSRFHGNVGDSVAVAQGGESAVDGAPIVFETGIDYLIAANGTTILTCGLSGQASSDLTRIYSEAFAGR